ncbi:MAG: sugar ABC transporter permease [Chloroflexi bacterium]|nr:sugar ABC transporter permease [Chloroflexota bacterium]
MAQLISKSGKAQRYRAAFFLSLPALIGLFLFHYWPIAETVRLSFTDYKVFTGEFTFTGLKNYDIALNDPLLFLSLKNTALFFLIKVPLQMVLGLCLAMLIAKPGRDSTLLRTLILFPAVTSMVVASIVWGMMFHSDIGIVNGVLESFGLPAQGFLRDKNQALPALASITIWKDVGLSMIFYLAGLLAIPSVYYEAARIDGAGRWEIFRYITLPLLNRTHAFVLVTSTIAAFKIFVPVEVLTDGGPSNATRVIVHYIFHLAFRFNRFSYATALSVILAIILIAISIFQLRITRDAENE